MSGDRLAQIETAVEITLRRSRDSAGSEPEFVVAPSSVSCADVLALVEIAKAARPFVEEYDFHAADYLADMVDGEEARVITARTVALLIEHQRALRSALARLDSGAAEEDA